MPERMCPTCHLVLPAVARYCPRCRTATPPARAREEVEVAVGSSAAAHDGAILISIAGRRGGGEPEVVVRQPGKANPGIRHLRVGQSFTHAPGDGYVYEVTLLADLSGEQPRLLVYREPERREEGPRPRPPTIRAATATATAEPAAPVAMIAVERPPEVGAVAMIFAAAGGALLILLLVLGVWVV